MTMFTVSLIGPDGVGKTTIARGLESSLPLPVKYIYMGLNIAAANFSLPTTRIWNAIQNRKQSKDRSTKILKKEERHRSSSSTTTDLSRQILRVVRKSLGLVNLILEEWYRQLIAYCYERFGYIVIFDRHFIYDFYESNGYDNREKKTINRKIHDLIRNRTLLAPDLVICLDAPAEVVFKRKGEFTIEDLEKKRRQYKNLQSVVKNFILIDATRSLDSVLKDVGDHIMQFHQSIL